MTTKFDLLVNRRLMELTHFSETITIANSAEVALHFLKTQCTNERYVPDLILLDIHLPGMNGYEFIEEFKNLPAIISRKSKIVLLTVFQKEEELEQALQNDFVIANLEKPLSH